VNSISVAIASARYVVIDVSLDQEEVEECGLELPAGQHAASLVVMVDLERLRPLMAKALRSKGRRSTLHDEAIEVRTVGTRPLREPEPVTVRERSGASRGDGGAP
jgi:hypothetical protein